MKLMFVVPSFGKGGAERVMSILSDHLIKRDHEVCLAIFSTEVRPLAYELNPGVKLIHIPHRHFTTPKQIKATLGELYKAFDAEKPDAVLCFFNNIGAQCAMACKRRKIPFIFSERNDPRRLMNSFKLRLFQKILVYYTKYVVFQTNGAKKIYPKRIQKRSAVILNPISENIISPYYGERKKEIVSVGRLAPQKRQDVMLRAFAKIAHKHPDYCLKIYGEGPQREELTKLIAELGLESRVFLEGNADDVFERIREASLFVFTSDHEGMPNALLEAMALGLPCVSTRCSPGGAEELITHGENGLLSPCADVEAFAREMDLLLSDDSLRAKLGARAVEVRKRVEVERIVDEWEEYIKKVVNYAK